MKGFIHTINRLPPAATTGGDIVFDMRAGGYVARDVDHVLLGAKTWPYAEKDAMVIYDGENSKITTFLDLPASVQRTMFTTALRVWGHLFRNNISDIDAWRFFLVIGTNMWIVPAPRMIQTIANPHFHTTLFPQYAHGEAIDLSWLQMIGWWDRTDDGKGSTYSTEVVQIDTLSEEHQKIFCIRPNNLLFRAGFMEWSRWWTESNLYTLDTPLIDQRDVFTSEANMKQFHSIYEQANAYIRSVTFTWNPDNRGFGISFVYDTHYRQWKIRLAFMEKKDSQDNWSICESSGHSILRKVTDNPARVMDTRAYVNAMAQSIF
jgi:hypothetical protein